MKSIHCTSIFVLLISVLIHVSASAAWWSSPSQDGGGEILELGWEDLIPANFKQSTNPLEGKSEEELNLLFNGTEESNALLRKMEEEFRYAPTVPELDGKRIKIAAYITPLDFDGQMKLKEFLLVPYMGACIHTPPPPANQVVHAQSSETIELSNSYDPVWAIGKLSATTYKTDLAEAGYQLEVEAIEPYHGN